MLMYVMLIVNKLRNNNITKLFLLKKKILITDLLTKCATNLIFTMTEFFKNLNTTFSDFTKLQSNQIPAVVSALSGCILSFTE